MPLIMSGPGITHSAKGAGTDLSNDPDERISLVTDALYPGGVSRFRRKIAEKWNEEKLTRDILLSQKRRAIVRVSS